MNNKKINTTEDSYEGWDDEFLWQRIELAMNKKRKKKYFIYFVVLGGICVLSGLLFLKNSKDGKIKSISSNINLTKDDDIKCIQTSKEVNKPFQEIKISQRNDPANQHLQLLLKCRQDSETLKKFLFELQYKKHQQEVMKSLL